MSTEEGGASGVDFSKMKVADLRAECEKKGLDSSGKKAELVSRLEGAATTTGGESEISPALASQSRLIRPEGICGLNQMN